MAQNVILARWIVVTHNDKGWAPHPSTGLFSSETEAQSGANQIVADGLSGAGDLLVKFVELSEIV